MEAVSGVSKRVLITGVGDPCTVSYWRNRPLSYSDHATERCYERDLPILLYLPEDARLADVDVEKNGILNAVTYKINCNGKSHFVVISSAGCVITTYTCDKSYTKVHHSKQIRRYKSGRF